jgi:hypothetical protein
VKQNDSRVRLLRLLQRKWDEPVKVAEIRCDQNYGWMGPSAKSGFWHWHTPCTQKRRTENIGKMCLGARAQVS